MEFLKRKVDEGADYICTQLFFDNNDFYDFRERCELAGIKVPIIAGIMPITSMDNLNRMSELALGARFPAKLKGYEGDACLECSSLTLVRNGSCLKCDTCGATTGCS